MNHILTNSENNGIVHYYLNPFIRFSDQILLPVPVNSHERLMVKRKTWFIKLLAVSNFVQKMYVLLWLQNKILDTSNYMTKRKMERVLREEHKYS